MITTTQDKGNNEAVLNALPSNPELGSYYWWARKARQYTGASMMDSGHNGRAHSNPVPAEDGAFMVDISRQDGVWELLGSINSIWWLATHTRLTETTAVMQKAVDELREEGVWGSGLTNVLAQHISDLGMGDGENDDECLGEFECMGTWNTFNGECDLNPNTVIHRHPRWGWEAICRYSHPWWGRCARWIWGCDSGRTQRIL